MQDAAEGENDLQLQAVQNDNVAAVEPEAWVGLETHVGNGSA